MRNFLKQLILLFTKFVTSGMNQNRKIDVLWRVAHKLYSMSAVEVETKKGRLLLDAGYRNYLGRVGEPGLEGDEPDTIDWIYSMPEGSCFWDIGSNIGIYGLLASLNSRIQVIGFEPASKNYAELNSNIELNNLADRFKAYCVALTDKTKLSTLNMSVTIVGSCGNEFDVEVDQFENEIDINFRQGALGISIDEFVRIFAPPLPTHVKIDVDGLEPEILRGGRNTLSSSTVKSVIIEVEEKSGSNRRSREISKLLSEFGFVPLPKVSPQYRNVIFNRPQH